MWIVFDKLYLVVDFLNPLFQVISQNDHHFWYLTISDDDDSEYDFFCKKASRVSWMHGFFLIFGNFPVRWGHKT